LESLSKDSKFKAQAGAFNERSLKSAGEERAAEQSMEADYAAALAQQEGRKRA